jgi:hypothetical protein
MPLLRTRLLKKLRQALPATHLIRRVQAVESPCESAVARRALLNLRFMKLKSLLQALMPILQRAMTTGRTTMSCQPQVRIQVN